MSLDVKFFCTFHRACRMKSELECGRCLGYYRLIQRLQLQPIDVESSRAGLRQAETIERD